MLVKKFLYNQKLAPYVFALPFILSFLIFFLYPICYAGVMSFHKILPGQFDFVGLNNYIQLFKNPQFYIAVRNSVVYTILTLLVLIPVPMILATLLHSRSAIGKNVFRSLLFIPALTSVVVAGIIARLIMGDLPTALLNTVVSHFGIEPQRWLTGGSQFTAYMALLSMCVWRWLGVNMLYYLSGLESIPVELYESASIDGANAWQKFLKITIPMLRPTTIYVLTISIYAGMSMFTESYILWNGNTSPRNVGLTIVGLLYRQGFQQNNMGMASAIGLLLLLFTLTVNLIQLRFSGIYKKEC